jgi:glycosyltransferase involved in cell wall biosynthesis
MARVIMAGTFDPAFHRNRKLRRLLELGDHEVITCRVDLWRKNRPEIPTRGKLAALARATVAYPRLIWRFLRTEHADLLLVAHPGWFDVLVLVPFARLRRMPVVFDMQISLYDTVVSDRGLTRPGSVLARFCWLADRFSLRLADRVIADTPAHADFFAEFAKVPPGKIGVVWLGAQDDVFHPRPEVESVDSRILFHGTFIRNQGLETIVRAAKLLEPDGIEVRLIGSGQEQEAVDRLVDQLRPANLVLVGGVPLEQVPEEIAAATLCLGIFGTSDRTQRVVPNKVYECLAVGRAVLTADTVSMRNAFREAEVALTEPGNPESLAIAVRRVLSDAAGREGIARAGHERYLADYSEEPLSRRLDAELQSALRDGLKWSPSSPPTAESTRGR